MLLFKAAKSGAGHLTVGEKMTTMASRKLRKGRELGLVVGTKYMLDLRKIPTLERDRPILRHTRGVGDEHEVLRKPLDSKTSRRVTLDEMPPTLQAPTKKAKPNKKS